MGHHILAKIIAILGAGLLAVLLLLALTKLLTPLILLLLLVPAIGGGIVASRILFAVARHTPYSDGQERFYNQEATVIVALTPAGRVRFHGENWAATLDDAFAAEHLPVGAWVRVVGLRDLCLIVTPSVSELVNRAHHHTLADPTGTGGKGPAGGS